MDKDWKWMNIIGYISWVLLGLLLGLYCVVLVIKFIKWIKSYDWKNTSLASNSNSISNNDSSISNNVSSIFNNDSSTSSNDRLRSTFIFWRFCAYSIIFPLCCIANHFNYIIIAFIHDVYHATSVAIVYGAVFLFGYGILQQFSYLLGNINCQDKEDEGDSGENKCLYIFWLLKPFLVLCLGLYVALDIILYFFLPIDDDFDDAANNFISLYQTVIVFITAVVAYFFINKPFRSPVSVFALAEQKEEILGISTKLKENSDRDRDLLMASEILKLLKEQQKYLQRHNGEDHSNS